MQEGGAGRHVHCFSPAALLFPPPIAALAMNVPARYCGGSCKTI